MSQTSLFICFLLISIFFISCGINNHNTEENDEIGGTDFVSDSFTEILTKGIIPNNLSTVKDNFLIDTLKRLEAKSGASITVAYMTESGSGRRTGSSWVSADSGNNLYNLLKTIKPSSSAVYVILLGAGVYRPSESGRVDSFALKNYTIIIGGFDVNASGEGSWTRSAGSITAFDGEIGDSNDRTDNIENIFNNLGTQSNPINRTAILYGVEIRGGYSDVSSESYGGGMFNKNASPSIIGVTFLNNYASRRGGGMFNRKSSPLIKDSSFIFNESQSGAGMYNEESSPLLVNTTFANNTASSAGGAMYNSTSSPTLINVTMVSNSDVSLAGGIYATGSHGSSVVRGTMLVNNILWTNKTGNNDVQIYLDNNEDVRQNLTLAETVLQDGINNIVIGSIDKSHNIINHGVINNNPNLDLSDISMSSFNRHFLLPTTSSATNIGLHVKINGSFAGDGNANGATLYFSKNGNDWYTQITSSGLEGNTTPPNSAISLTKYDATGYERTGRPDAGAYEAR